MQSFEVFGGGVTDFRPAFEYISQLQSEGELRNLKGMLLFYRWLRTNFRPKHMHTMWHLYLLMMRMPISKYRVGDEGRSWQ